MAAANSNRRGKGDKGCRNANRDHTPETISLPGNRPVNIDHCETIDGTGKARVHKAHKGTKPVPSTEAGSNDIPHVKTYVNDLGEDMVETKQHSEDKHAKEGHQAAYDARKYSEVTNKTEVKTRSYADVASSNNKSSRHCTPIQSSDRDVHTHDNETTEYHNTKPVEKLHHGAISSIHARGNENGGSHSRAGDNENEGSHSRARDNENEGSHSRARDNENKGSHSPALDNENEGRHSHALDTEKEGSHSRPHDTEKEGSHSHAHDNENESSHSRVRDNENKGSHSPALDNENEGRHSRACDNENEDTNVHSRDKENADSNAHACGNENEDKNKARALEKLRQIKTNDDDEDDNNSIDYTTGYESTQNSKHDKGCNYGVEAIWHFKLEEARKEAHTKYEYFWKNKDIYSQWHTSRFSVDGEKFENAEQFMMYNKAKLFGDDRIAKKMLSIKNPAKIKALGRQVKQFNADTWNYHRLHVVKEGNIAKYSQNKHLKKKLFNTYPKLLVEASPFDPIWGIGLDEYDRRAWDESTWQGENLLGYIITEVRDELMADEGFIAKENKQEYLDKLMQPYKGYGTSVDPPAGCTDENMSESSAPGENIPTSDNLTTDKNQGSEGSSDSQKEPNLKREHTPEIIGNPCNVDEEDPTQVGDLTTDKGQMTEGSSDNEKESNLQREHTPEITENPCKVDKEDPKTDKDQMTKGCPNDGNESNGQGGYVPEAARNPCKVDEEDATQVTEKPNDQKISEGTIILGMPETSM